MRIFISQERIDRWLDQGRVELEGQIMSVPALGRSFQLQPAVYFKKVVSDDVDPEGLVGRVKSKLQLEKMGAEDYATSVILGETAYDCEPGFIGVVAGGAPIGSGLAQLSE